MKAQDLLGGEKSWQSGGGLGDLVSWEPGEGFGDLSGDMLVSASIDYQQLIVGFCTHTYIAVVSFLIGHFLP